MTTSRTPGISASSGSRRTPLRLCRLPTYPTTTSGPSGDRARDHFRCSQSSRSWAPNAAESMPGVQTAAVDPHLGEAGPHPGAGDQEPIGPFRHLGTPVVAALAHHRLLDGEGRDAEPPGLLEGAPAERAGGGHVHQVRPVARERVADLPPGRAEPIASQVGPDHPAAAVGRQSWSRSHEQHVVSGVDQAVGDVLHGRRRGVHGWVERLGDQGDPHGFSMDGRIEAQAATAWQRGEHRSTGRPRRAASGHPRPFGRAGPPLRCLPGQTRILSRNPTEVAMASTDAGVTGPTRAQIQDKTLRADRWWLAPLVTFIVFTAFVIYATWRAFAGSRLLLLAVPLAVLLAVPDERLRRGLVRLRPAVHRGGSCRRR